MSIFLAQFWGLIFVIMGGIFLIRRESVKVLIKMVQDDGMMILTGYAALIVGIAHVLLYNVWVSDWRVVLTLIGWMALVKGIIRLTFPDFTRKMIKQLDKPNNIGILLVILVIVGIYLLIHGFGL